MPCCAVYNRTSRHHILCLAVLYTTAYQVNKYTALLCSIQQNIKTPKTLPCSAVQETHKYIAWLCSTQIHCLARLYTTEYQDTKSFALLCCTRDTQIDCLALHNSISSQHRHCIALVYTTEYIVTKDIALLCCTQQHIK